MTTSFIRMPDNIFNRRADGGWITGANLNDYKTPGVYAFREGNTNCPVAWCSVVVLNIVADNVLQLLFQSTNMYFREFRSNTWGAWQKVTTTTAT